MTPALPRLRAATRRLTEIPDLLTFADPQQPLVWLRGDRGCVGIGSVLRLEFRGPDRFSEAADAWRQLAEAAEVDDQVGLPGTGLIALGTFAFADDSAAGSVLVVPQFLVARHRDEAWITEVSVVDTSGEAAVSETSIPSQAAAAAVAARSVDATALPKPTPLHSWHGITLPLQPEAATVSPEIAAYIGGVDEAGLHIQRGDVDKVVLARQVSVDIAEDADIRVPLQRLAARYLDCWTFAVDGLIGASPETLIRSTDGAVSARVLAGTRARDAGDTSRDTRVRDELLTSDKDQHEHSFAVQSVVTALSPHLPDLRTSEEPFALGLPNVWHLATDLGATLPNEAGVNSIELVGALHPTAAVAGTPTADAIDLIAQLEPFDRGRYAGAVGWIDAAGDGEWVIALRCAQLGEAVAGHRTVTATAGGGIVVGSNPEHELAETVSKFRPIADALS